MKMTKAQKKVGKVMGEYKAGTLHSGKGGKVTIEGRSLKAEDLTKEQLRSASDDKLIRFIADGIEDEGMPAFKDKLTGDQIKLIVKHVRTLQK